MCRGLPWHRRTPASKAFSLHNACPATPTPRYGEWRKVLELEPPGQDARGVTHSSGVQYTQVRMLCAHGNRRFAGPCLLRPLVIGSHLSYIQPPLQVVYHYVRVLALTARAEAYTARALRIPDRTAFELAVKGAETRQAEVAKETAALRVRALTCMSVSGRALHKC